jgi:hypothetical protein
MRRLNPVYRLLFYLLFFTALVLTLGVILGWFGR